MISVDIEASGGEFLRHGICQIGALDTDNPLNEFIEQCRIDDDDAVLQEAMDITGFDEKRLRDGSLQSQKVMLERFLKWTESVQNKSFICHNTQFDYAFIKCKLEKYGLENSIPWHAFDIHSLASLKFLQVRGSLLIKNDQSDMHLSKIINFCGMEDLRVLHNALEDAKLTAECYSRIMYGKNLIKDYKKYPMPEYLKISRD